MGDYGTLALIWLVVNLEKNLYLSRRYLWTLKLS